MLPRSQRDSRSVPVFLCQGVCGSELEVMSVQLTQDPRPFPLSPFPQSMMGACIFISDRWISEGQQQCCPAPLGWDELHGSVGV